MNEMTWNLFAYHCLDFSAVPEDRRRGNYTKTFCSQNFVFTTYCNEYWFLCQSNAFPLYFALHSIVEHFFKKMVPLFSYRTQWCPHRNARPYSSKRVATCVWVLCVVFTISTNGFCVWHWFFGRDRAPPLILIQLQCFRINNNFSVDIFLMKSLWKQTFGK